MAFPQPDPAERTPDGAPSPSRSLADSPPARARDDAVWFTVCAWCDSVDVDGAWIELARALELVAPSADGHVQLTHGICPPCFATVSADADRDRGLGTDVAESDAA